MRQVVVGFSTSKKWMPGSAIIKAFMGRKFSHTYLRFNLEDKYDTVFHAVGKGGLVFWSYDGFLERNTVIREFILEVPDWLFSTVFSVCHKNAGVKYGFLQNIGLGLVRIANKFGFKINKNPINDGVNCSEWVAFMLQIVDRMTFSKDLDLIAPDEVYDYMDRREQRLLEKQKDSVS